MPTVTAAAPIRTKDTKPMPKREAMTASWVGRVPQLKPAQYADGMPIHSPEYICCKLILRPNKFYSRESFFEFGKVFKEPAKEHGVKYHDAGFDSTSRSSSAKLFSSIPRTSASTTMPSFFAAASPTRTASPSASRKSSSSSATLICRLRGNRRAPAHPRRPSRQVQGPGHAAEGEARRNTPAVFTQRSISALRHRHGQGKRQRHGRPDRSLSGTELG